MDVGEGNGDSSPWDEPVFVRGKGGVLCLFVHPPRSTDQPRNRADPQYARRKRLLRDLDHPIHRESHRPSPRSSPRPLPLIATEFADAQIASASGESVPPEQSTVYNGQAVQWGTGSLVAAAPAVITGSGSGSGNASSSAAPSSADSTASGPAQVSTISVAPSASATDDSVNAAAAVSSSSSSSSRSASGSSTRAAASASATQSGAALRGSTVGLGAVVLGLAGLIAV